MLVVIGFGDLFDLTEAVVPRERPDFELTGNGSFLAVGDSLLDVLLPNGEVMFDLSF